MEIIEEDVKEYHLVYESAHGYGYSFPCDKMGHVLLDECPYPDTAKKSLAYCKAHPEKWSKNGDVVTLIRHNRYGICPYCGHKINFCGSGYMGAFDCECGKWYNRFGQELVPPEDWYDDDDWDDLYNDWKDESYKYWAEYIDS